MLEQAPNGFFARDLLVFGSLDRGGIVAKGFTFEAPDFQNADDAELNRFHDQIALMLAAVNSANQRLQVQWHCDSDYRAELLRYKDETERAANPWTRRCRNERFLRYWQAMKNRRLRREKLTLFLSRRIETTPGIKLTGRALQHYYDQLLGELASEFQQFHELVASIFTGQGARVVPMTDADHFRHYHRFLNPAVTARFDYDPLDTFRPERSIQENCWLSECVGLPDSGFFMDGHYHSVLVLRQWPKGTFPGIIRRLTAQRILDYSITVNVTPLPVREEILKEEKAHERVAGDYAAEKRVSFLSVLAKKERKIKALMDGMTLPFNALFIIRIWDRSREGLAASTAAIKSAVNSMNGAQYFEANVATTTKKLFYMTWPGWAWGRYTAHSLYAESHYLPDLLPFSSTFIGHLATAEAIYDGDEGNIVGVKTFAGEVGNMSPQHAVLLGMSGAGKSVNMCDLLTQTEPYYDYTVLIEEGLSYGIYTQTVEPGAQPIILQPDGTLTLNYLDTQGLPLSSLHLATCTALVCRMIGEAADPERQALRQAQVSRYLLQLYEAPSKTGATRTRWNWNGSPARPWLSTAGVPRGCSRAPPCSMLSRNCVTAALPGETKEPKRFIHSSNHLRIVKFCASSKTRRPTRRSCVWPSPASAPNNTRPTRCSRRACSSAPTGKPTVKPSARWPICSCPGAGMVPTARSSMACPTSRSPAASPTLNSATSPTPRAT